MYWLGMGSNTVVRNGFTIFVGFFSGWHFGGGKHNEIFFSYFGLTIVAMLFNQTYIYIYIYIYRERERERERGNRYV